MKDTRNLHLKVQEHADCYATTDPLKEMSEINKEADLEEAALKWIALAVLHGINENAEKVSLFVSDDGSVSVTAAYRKSELPAPNTTIGKKIHEIVGNITHIEGDKGKIQLALGILDSSIDLKIKMKTKDNGKKISIKFPES